MNKTVSSRRSRNPRDRQGRKQSFVQAPVGRAEALIHRTLFVLPGSSQRIGVAFWNEVQHIAVESLNVDQEKAIQTGIAIRDRFYQEPEKLQAAYREMVEDYSSDTDSANSDDD